MVGGRRGQGREDGMRGRACGFAFLLILPLALGTAPSAAATGSVNWPQFRFNQNHTGVNTLETTINASNIVLVTLDWAAQLGKLVDFSSPAVVNGVAYIGSDDGRLWAYPADGCGQSVCSPLWQGLAGSKSILQSSPTLGSGLLFVAAFDGRLYAFNARGCGAATCQPVWKGSTGGSIESSPTVVGGVAYVGSDDGKLYAFNAAGCGAPTCPPLWTGSIGGPAFESRQAVGGPLWLDFGSGAQAQVQSSPAVANGLVYAARNTGEVLAWRTGPCGGFVCSNIWSGATGDPLVNSSPTVVNGKIYIGSADDAVPEEVQGRLYVFDLST